MSGDFPYFQAAMQRGYAITALVLALAIAIIADNASRAADEFPRSGVAAKEFAELDQIMERFARLTNSSAVTVAVSRHGELRYSRGYGWLDFAHTKTVEPADPFRIASVAKPFTAALTYQLIADRRLKPEDLVYPLPGIDPPDGKLVDERWKKIRVSHLLEHLGGWDREQAGDPMFKLAEIKKSLKLESEPRQRDVIRYMLGQRLQFEPGKQLAYSNFGYCVLGRVCEKASDEDYFTALTKYVLQPKKISGIALAKRAAVHRLPREPQYNLPEDEFEIEVMDAHGGLVASAPALCQFLTHFWVSGKPRKLDDGEQNWNFFGSLPGTTSMVRQTRGWDVALLFNGRREEHINEDLESLGKEIQQVLKTLPLDAGAIAKP